MNLKKITYSIFLILFVSVFITGPFSTGCHGKSEEDTKRSQRIEEYKSKLDDFNAYDQEVFIICSNYAERINLLVKKFNASKSDLCKKASYADLLAGEYNSWFSDLSVLTLSEFLKDLQEYRLERLLRKESWYRYFADNAGKGDINKLDELKDEIESVETKCKVEYDRILEYFNSEASELGLPEPFSNP